METESTPTGSSPVERVVSLRRAWTTTEQKLLRDLYPMTANEEIAKRLQRTRIGVAVEANRRGLKKSLLYFRQEPYRRRGMHPNTIAARNRRIERMWEAGYLRAKYLAETGAAIPPVDASEIRELMSEVLGNINDARANA